MGATTVTGKGTGDSRTRLAYLSTELPKLEILQTSNNPPGLTTVTPSITPIPPVDGDGRVKITSTDQADFLANKLVAGENISLTINPGPDETLKIDATPIDSGQVKIDSTDQVLDFLANKLVAGANISFTVNPGPNETLTINATSSISPFPPSVTPVVIQCNPPGGNPRGFQAIDLQCCRISDTQVASGDQSFIASGCNNTASGQASHAEGFYSTASGQNSHAEGYYSVATGFASHAEGTGITDGRYGHAEGQSRADGYASHAEGAGHAYGTNSHAEGASTADGKDSHSEGTGHAYADYSHAEGSSFAHGTTSHAEGNVTNALGNFSHSEGGTTYARGYASHAEGANTRATGNAAHSEGRNTYASGNYGHAEGGSCTAGGVASHAEGNSTIASANYSHTEGSNTKVLGLGNFGHAEGNTTTVSGPSGHAEGNQTTASGNISHAEGDSTIASGDWSHAEGNTTTASGKFSHSEGSQTTASGYNSHAEGNQTVASGIGSHAGGILSVADKKGQWARASGFFAFANDAQISNLTLMAITSGAATTEATLDSGAPTPANRLIICVNRVYSVMLRVVAHDVSGVNSATYTRYFLIENNGGTTTIIGSVQTIGTDIGSNAGAPPVGWTIAVTADNVNSSLKLSVTGPSGTIRWLGRVETAELGF